MLFAAAAEVDLPLWQGISSAIFFVLLAYFAGPPLAKMPLPTWKRLLPQRRPLRVVSDRRGASSSHSAITARTPKKKPNRTVASSEPDMRALQLRIP